MFRRRAAARCAPFLLSATLLAGCDRPPTGPSPTSRRVALSLATAAADNTIVGIDLGVLPGDRSSEAAFITDDGTVYGFSYPDELRPDYAPGPTGEPPFRRFRWTPGEGIRQVMAFPPRPVPPIPAGAPAIARAANAKGEVTGASAEELFLAHAWRWSRDAGLRFLEPADDGSIERSAGVAINRWGHVAGPRTVFDIVLAGLWTPVAGFGEPGDRYAFVNVEAMPDPGFYHLNDNDQVLARGGVIDVYGVVWRPDLGARILVQPGYTGGDLIDTDAAGQNARNQVVGWARIGSDERSVAHAVLWNVPAVDRAGFPTIDTRPIATQTSTVRLSTSRGVYYQLFRTAQSPTAGPWTEIIDWGDGTTTRRPARTLGTRYAAHSYARTGTYWVRAYVEDRLGRWAVGEQRVTVVP
jgi:hypothetical protein